MDNRLTNILLPSFKATDDWEFKKLLDKYYGGVNLNAKDSRQTHCTGVE